MYIFAISEIAQSWTYIQSQKTYKGAMCFFQRCKGLGLTSWAVWPNKVDVFWVYWRTKRADLTPDSRGYIYYITDGDRIPSLCETQHIEMFLEKARWAHFLKQKSRGWRDSTPGPGIHHQSVISMNSQGRKAGIRAEAYPSHGFQVKHFSHNRPSLKMLWKAAEFGNWSTH